MIRSFRVTDFRCLRAVELDFSPGFNLVVGPNASGKTSLLEAVAYLGRGKSFRGASTSNLVRHGQHAFVLFGRVDGADCTHSVGVRNSRAGLEVRIDGENAGGAAALAAALPLQIIDPDVHNLVAGGPEQRRRYLDWVAFHVEPGHLATWRRFRRVLKQRNAALKAESGAAAIAGWDREFTTAGAALDASRRRALEHLAAHIVDFGRLLLGTELGFEYQQGWRKDLPLEAAVADGFDRDRQQGATQHGPHRADVRICYDERLAKKLVSRGQQKLLASAMILGATETAQAALGRPLLLLLDDPSAELDADSLARLLGAVTGLGSQVIATSLEPESLGPPAEARVFHVEQGAFTGAGDAV